MVHGGGTRSGNSRRSGGGRNFSVQSNNRSRLYRNRRRQQGLFSGGIFTPRVSTSNHYHLHTSSAAQSPVNTTAPTSSLRTDGSDEGDSECCCYRSCCWFCTTQSNHDPDSAPGSVAAAFCWRKLPGLAVLSLVLFGILVAISSQDDRWILNAGESRRISPAFLTHNVNVQVEWDSHQNGVDVSLYALRSCPPLTGPPVSVSNQHIMTLGRGDYQYDYFYLNAGSKVSASFAQSQGSSEIFLLRGSDILSRLKGHSDDIDWEDIDRSAISNWYISSGSATKTVNFRADRTDTYIVLYDNQSSSIGKLSMSYSMKLTTYNLKGHSPICSDAVTTICPPIETKGAGCIIVDTTPGSSDEPGGEVSLRIIGHRRWFAIFLWSILPGSLIVARHLYATGKMRREWQQVPFTDDDNGDEVVYNDTVRIPAHTPPSATAPGHTPIPPPATAPVEEHFAPVASVEANAAVPVVSSAPMTEQETHNVSIPIARAEVIPEPVVGSVSLSTIEVPIDQIDPMPIAQK